MLPDCILHLGDFVTFYEILLVLQCLEYSFTSRKTRAMLSSRHCWCFSGDVGVSGHRKGEGEQGEVTSFVLSTARYEK